MQSVITVACFRFTVFQKVLLYLLIDFVRSMLMTVFQYRLGFRDKIPCINVIYVILNVLWI